MKSNVKSVKLLPDSTKEVFSYDKNGKRVSKTEKVTGRYLIVTHTGSSVVLTKEQIKQYGIICDLPRLQNETVTQTVVTNPTQNVTTTQNS